MDNGEAISLSEIEADPEVDRWLGPARLAYFTPVREYPPLADRKSVTLLSLNGLMLTIMCLFLDEIRTVVGGDSPIRYLVIPAGLAWFGLVVAGGYYSFLALVQPIPPMGPCIAFFKNIAATTLASYREMLAGLSHFDAMNDILNYNYSIAKLSTEKFRLIKKSVLCLCLALPTWMLMMVLFAVRAIRIWIIRI